MFHWMGWEWLKFYLGDADILVHPLFGVHFIPCNGQRLINSSWLKCFMVWQCSTYTRHGLSRWLDSNNHQRPIVGSGSAVPSFRNDLWIKTYVSSDRLTDIQILPGAVVPGAIVPGACGHFASSTPWGSVYPLQLTNIN